MSNSANVGKWFIGVLALLLSACATSTPEYVAADLQAETIGHVSVLPIVDHRVDQSKDLNLEKKYYKKLIKKRVKKAHYDFTIESDPAFIAAVTRDGLEDMNAEMIQQLGPEASRWVLLLTIDDSDSKLGLGSSGTAEVTGYLFDKQSQAVVWQNKELGERSEGGVLGMMMKGAMQQQAVLRAIDIVLKGLPEKEKL